ncbi:MAG: alpha/beta fold hydrolase [Sulfitobacter sp.]|nr:alpha/beta fold hydrolase [Sulfitobacter sp.]
MIAKILNFVVISGGITLAIALVLIFTQRPAALPAGEGLDFTKTLDGGGTTAMPNQTVQMRDGYDLAVRRYPGPDEGAPLLVLVHGSGWHGLQFDGLARDLSDLAQVIVPDLRGHGARPGRRGDVDYIGQLEDDLADLIAAESAPGQKILLGGHSSGGGLVVRFAGGKHGDLIDGAILMAPFLKYDAPTTRPNSGGWAHVLTRRIIGLSILNTFRIRALNHLPIIQFRMPAAVMEGPLGDTATTAYSYRLNRSFAPRRDYLADAAGLPPFLLVAGSEDEAFFADRYEPTLSKATDKGRYVILPGEGHLDIVDVPGTATAIREFLDGI